MSKLIELIFVGIDHWNRPIFKSDKGSFYGSVNNLFDYDANKEEVLRSVTEEDLCYFGNKFGCEPLGSSVSNIKIVR